MQRNAAALVDGEFDVLVIGAGAFGAAAAYDAAMRGLRTALIDRTDFGAGSSAECFKMVHGGIRYLQHADVRRVRASCRERSALLRIAPHLVNPLPIAIPTYGRGRSGKLFLGAGACAYDLLTWDRNAAIRDPERRIRRTQFLTRDELLKLFPHLDAPALNGAVVFEDGQMYNPARLVLAFVKSAVVAGATACNYVEAKEFLWQGAAVRGVQAIDRSSGAEFEIRAKLTLNAAGPWAEYLYRDGASFREWRRSPYSRDAYFIIERPPTSPYALAVQGTSRDKDAKLGRATRHLFMVPWRNRTLIGVWHRLFMQHPDAATVTPQEIEKWIEELNSVYPQLALSPSEVTFANSGLVPFGETATETELSFGKESRFIDHRQAHGVAGLVSLIGIRFTTARGDAARALDLLLQQWDGTTPASRTAQLALAGGDIESFAQFRQQAQRAHGALIDSRSLDALLRNHGTDYRDVIRLIDKRNVGAQPIAGTSTIAAEIWCAANEEMAVHLDDVVLRRTDLSADQHPGRAALDAAAVEMGRCLGWTSGRVGEEIARTEAILNRHLAYEQPAHRSAHMPQGAPQTTPPTAINGAMLAKIPA